MSPEADEWEWGEGPLIAGIDILRATEGTDPSRSQAGLNTCWRDLALSSFMLSSVMYEWWNGIK